MTTPTPSWGDPNSQSPYGPTETPAAPTPSPWGRPTPDPNSPATGLGTEPLSAPAYTSPAYGTPSYDAPAYGTPSYDPAYDTSAAPAPTGGYDPNAYAQTTGYDQSGGYGYGQTQYPQTQYAQPESASYAQDPASGYYQAAPAQPYGLAAYAGIPAQLPTGLAIASMVCGITGLVLGLCGWTIPVSIAAVILGAVGLQKEKRGEAGGKGMAIAGVVTGGIGIVISTIMLLLVLVAMVAD